MAWKNRAEYRCEHCGARICRNILVQFNGGKYPNRRKKCTQCERRGCLFCMTGNAKHGILQHKDCENPPSVAIQQLLYPSRHRIELGRGIRLISFLTQLAQNDVRFQEVLIDRLPESEPDSLFPLIFAFVIAPESAPALRTLSGSSKWAGLALDYQERYGEAQPAGSVTSD